VVGKHVRKEPQHIRFDQWYRPYPYLELQYFNSWQRLSDAALWGISRSDTLKYHFICSLA
jgi:hypothetical protein